MSNDTIERVLHRASKWVCEREDTAEIAGAQAELAALRQRCADLERDKARLDHLEGEFAREEQWRGSARSVPCPRSLFRYNRPITRAAIDEARAALARGEPSDHAPAVADIERGADGVLRATRDLSAGEGCSMRVGYPPAK